MNKAKNALVQQETETMMRKGAIHLVLSQKGKFVSNLFLVSNKNEDEENRPVGNSKKLNKFLPYQHLKVKDAYFYIPLYKDSFGFSGKGTDTSSFVYLLG